MHYVHMYKTKFKTIYRILFIFPYMINTFMTISVLGSNIRILLHDNINMTLHLKLINLIIVAYDLFIVLTTHI